MISANRFSGPSARSKTLMRRNMLRSLEPREDTNASWLNDVLPPTLSKTSMRVQTQEHTVNYEDLPTMPLSAFKTSLAVQTNNEEHVDDDQTIRLSKWRRNYKPNVFDTLLLDETVSAITALGPTRIYVERNGTVEQVDFSFSNEQHMMLVIEKLLQRAMRPIPFKHPLVDIALSNNLLLTAVLPPSALNGPAFTVRRVRKSCVSFAELVHRGLCNHSVAEQLRNHVKTHSNLLIVGPVGSGRTMLLDALCGLIPTDERIVTIEDVAELQFVHDCRVALQTNKMEHITTKELLTSVEHLGMQRIIVGECRGEEAEMLLQSMYSGFNGVMTTLYALDAQDALKRFETLCAMAIKDQSPAHAMHLRTQIAQSIDVIVTLSQEHKIVDIYEVKRESFVL